MNRAAAVNKKDALFVLNNLLEMHPMRKDAYYGSLRTLGLIIIDDRRFFHLPIDADAELRTLPSADFERCAALLCMLLREDHWFENAFDERLVEGWPQRIVKRMIALLEEQKNTEQ